MLTRLVIPFTSLPKVRFVSESGSSKSVTPSVSDLKFSAFAAVNKASQQKIIQVFRFIKYPLAEDLLLNRRLEELQKLSAHDQLLPVRHFIANDRFTADSGTSNVVMRRAGNGTNLPFNPCNMLTETGTSVHFILNIFNLPHCRSSRHAVCIIACRKRKLNGNRYLRGQSPAC